MRSERGQVGIIVLLISVVMLTVGVSVISRTTTDVSISETNEQGSRALDAAESAVEQAFSNPAVLDTTSPDINDQSVSVTSDLQVQYDANKLRYIETELDEGEVVAINVEGAPNPARIRVEWSREKNCTTGTPPASLAVTSHSISGNTYMVRHYYYTHCSDPVMRAIDHFSVTDPTWTIPGSPYFRYKDYSVLPSDKLVRIRPVYGATAIRISSAQANWTLSPQMFKVTASAQNSTSKETKVVEVDRSLPVAPAILDYALYSGTSITHSSTP